MATPPPVSCTDLTRDQRVDAVVLLATSFRHEPCLRWIFADQLPHLDAALTALFGVACDVRFALGWPCHGAWRAERLVGTAGVSLNTADAWPPTLVNACTELTQRIGPQATALEDVHRPTAATIAVGMVGVDPTAQRQGVGQALLDRVHALAQHDPATVGVYVCTTDPRNVPFYRRAGYALLHEHVLAPDVSFWAL